MNGSVNPNGATATFYFEYGPTTTYGHVTASGTAATSLNASYTLNSLSPRSAYHYRLVAYNSGGTNYGGDALISTPALSGPICKITPLCVYASDSPYTTVDLLVSHTAQATNVAGGWPTLEHKIIDAVNDMNTAFVNSLITNRVRLLDIRATPFQETLDAGVNISNLLAAVPPLDGLHYLRDQYGADLVGLIVGPAMGQVGGISKQLTNNSTAYASNALVVVSYLTMANYFGLAHELGHVMGAGHSWIIVNEIGGDRGVFPYSYGYQFTNSGQIYGDIMSYAFKYNGPNGQPGEILPYYSNPLVTYAGVPIGQPAGTAFPADNATTLNITRTTAAQFRPTVVPTANLVNVTNLGDSALTISGITLNPMVPWITIPVSVPIVVPPGGYTQIAVDVDYSAAPPGFSSTRMFLASSGVVDPENNYEVLIMVDNHTSPPPPRLAAQSGGGTIQLDVSTRPQETATVWKSADLQSWSVVFQTNSPGAFSWTEAVNPSAPRAFYRISSP